MSGTLAGLMCPLVMAFDAPLLLRLHATVHGYVGDVRPVCRSVRVNGMIMTGLPCGKAGHNHDNITLYSCDRGLVPLFPDANLPPTTMMPSAIAEPLFPSSGHEFVPVKTSID